MATPAVANSSVRGALDELLTRLPSLLVEAGTGGTACRAIADVYDTAIAQRFSDAAAGIASPLALVATGGWARRELAPYSDIDFIILHDKDEIAAKQVADRLLYPLWDEKLAIGHSLREVRAVAKLAKSDLATATALLDARHIAGSRLLSTELARATLTAVAPAGNPNELIATLAAEKAARHDRFGASLYLLEPNLKQGIGGLRDLATALWAASVRWHPLRPGRDPHTSDALIELLTATDHLTRRQRDVLLGARDFLLRIRALVQLTTRRRFDQLTFEIQEAIAPPLYPHARAHDGDIRSAVAPAVEALMGEYYVHARGVAQVADRLLEAARVPSKRKVKVEQIDASFITYNGELAVREPTVFERSPSEMIRLFRVAVTESLPIYGNTRELVTETIARDPTPLAADPASARLFLDALVDERDRAQPSAFEVMHQVGILSALMPEWRPCTCRVQHDLYHVYTVDQHQLLALQMQKRLARGELAAEHPLATALWNEVKRPAALYLGTLLHDVGKPLGKGHAEKGAVVTGDIARRLGMSADDAELAAFLVRQHLTMSHLSQRRDLSDPDVIARFAERVGSDDRLVSLYLLTLCDSAMTNPENLSAWKAGLLGELMVHTRAHFRGDAVNEPRTDRESRAKIVVVAADDGGLEPEAARAIVDGIDPRLLVQLTPRQTARHVKLVASTRGKQPPVAIEVHCYPMKGHSEVAIVAPDAPGVLAAIAGALAASRVDVLGAILGHVDLDAGRLVTDTFFVRDLKGEAIPEDDPRWARLASDLREILVAAPNAAAVANLIARRRPKSGMPKRHTPEVPTEIRLHDESTQATIVEVFTRDRAGVLYAITQTLADLGLDISLAKVSTEGEKVADVFYVTRGGQHITDDAERDALVSKLRAAVETAELVGS